MVQENLFKQHENCYQGAIFVLATNALPTYDHSGYTQTEFAEEVWKPMMARTDLIYATESHQSGGDFPYTTAELAHALAFLTRHPSVCDSLCELDSTDVPAVQESSLDWHRDLAKRQNEKFGAEIEQIAGEHPDEDESPFPDSSSATHAEQKP